MNQNENLGDLTSSENTFGTGFILGAAAASLVIFFLVTKTGKALAKKLTAGDFDVDKFVKSLTENLDNLPDWFEQTTKTNQENLLEPNIGSEQTTKLVEPPVLGRRFFRRKK